jgi:hypothetical protein
MPSYDHHDGNLLGVSQAPAAFQDIPTGSVPPLPSLPGEEVDFFDQIRTGRDEYAGGLGDPKHLGGFAEYNGDTVSPAVWKRMVEKFGIRSVLDIGCGRGFSTLWFLLHEVDALCVEGSSDAINQSLLEANEIIHHDYTRGPWWPSHTVDAVWAADFVQQVSLHHQHNYLAAFRKAALLFLTFPRDGAQLGWHNVEVHGEDWWKQRMELHGFVYDANITSQIRQTARTEAAKNLMGPSGERYFAHSIISTMMVRRKSDHFFNSN